jgi:hypothetical protein
MYLKKEIIISIFIITMSASNFYMRMIWLYGFLLDFLIPFLCDPGLQCGVGQDIKFEGKTGFEGLVRYKKGWMWWVIGKVKFTRWYGNIGDTETSGLYFLLNKFIQLHDNTQFGFYWQKVKLYVGKGNVCWKYGKIFLFDVSEVGMSETYVQ